MSMSTEETLRLTVAALAQARGETQADLAAAIGSTQAQVSRRQAGRTAWTLADCDRLAAHYGIPVPLLLSGPTAACHALPPTPPTPPAPGPAAPATTPTAPVVIPAAPASAARPAPAPTAPVAAPAAPAPATAADPGLAAPLAPPAAGALPAPEAAPAPTAAAPLAAPSMSASSDTPPAAPAAPALAPDTTAPDRTSDGELLLASPLPCVRCGRPTAYRFGGRPRHLGDLCTTTPPAPVPAEATSATPTPAPAAAEADPAEPPAPAPAAGRPRPYQDPAPVPDLIGRAVAEETAKHPSDPEAVTAALARRAIPDAMTLLDVCRLGGRYDFTAYPPAPDILKKKTARGADEIWEARPKWRAPRLPPGRHQVTALDMNGAYLTALKTHLPIGALQHHTGPDHDRRRSGVHLVTPGAWHMDDLPNPLGSREEPGPLWIAEPTLRLLLRLSAPPAGDKPLCDAPLIHESWTSGSSENLLEKFRCVLRDAREDALARGDEITLEYVKTMYSKFVSTMGESNANHAIRRSDWMHIVRAQAFANLWLKAHKAHQAGLTVVQVAGTDELHLIGDWNGVFSQGRGVHQVKVKDTYELGAA